ncbi:MAG: hypothetical protein ABW156_01325 [Jiangellaceae bacterium]
MRPLAGVFSPLRMLVLVLVSALVLAGVWLWLDRDNGGAEIVGDSSRSGWMTIRFEGVRVDIPATWERLDRDDCDFKFEVWAPPHSDGCEWAGGVAFYSSATFDANDKPGARRTETPDEPEWGGYTYARDFAVYASDDDREIVSRVLGSAR